MPAHALAALMLLAILADAGCASSGTGPAPELQSLPDVNEYCLAAERVVTRTSIPMKLRVQPDFAAFVTSKALIEGPTIQQFNWTDANGRTIGISCKLKNADHLVATFGADTAGPDGSCQDMNRAVYALLARTVRRPVFGSVAFEPDEVVLNTREPGPAWLAPHVLTSVGADGALRISAKALIIHFNDPAYAAAPARFRGVHYCHFIAPGHLLDLLEGRARPGAVIGQIVDTRPVSE